MKLLKMALSMLSLTGIASCVSLKPYPISMATTKIVYAEHANSGIASQTRYELTADSLIWDFTEPRYSRHLRDVAQVSGKDFEALVTALSTIKFSAKDKNDPSAGGSGWGCGFYDEKGRYLQFNDHFKLSGDYEQVIELIVTFAEQHKPEGLKRYDELKAQPHERGMYGDFDELPKELEIYLIDKKR